MVKGILETLEGSRVADFLREEEERQNKDVELIASENYPSERVLAAMSGPFSAKYAEGYPDLPRTGKKGRYYGGCEIIDRMEQYCCEMWQKVFNTDYHVNVQPHSGSSANMAVYFALMKPGEKILSLGLNEGGHLSHGSPVSFSGKQYQIVNYGLTEDGYIDYDNLEEQIQKEHPQLIIAGASAYPRVIDFKEIKKRIERQSTDTYKPYFMVDMAHIAGLIAGGIHPTPFGIADVITTTTHKTLRGPRGGMIFCKPELAKKIDSAVFPGIQGGPLEHVIAAKAVAAEEAVTDAYKMDYIGQVAKNCKAFAKALTAGGMELSTGGTDTHLILIDLSNTHPNLTGKEAEKILKENGIIVNKNCVPGEKRSPMEASGIRLGTPAMTTKGWKEEDFERIAETICDLLRPFSQDADPTVGKLLKENIDDERLAALRYRGVTDAALEKLFGKRISEVREYLDAFSDNGRLYLEWPAERLLKVNLPDGYLLAEPSQDPDYPGIDVEYIANKDGYYTRPRVLIEKPLGYSPEAKLRTLVWAEPKEEDYTESIEFNNEHYTGDEFDNK